MMQQIMRYGGPQAARSNIYQSIDFDVRNTLARAPLAPICDARIGRVSRHFVTLPPSFLPSFPTLSSPSLPPFTLPLAPCKEKQAPHASSRSVGRSVGRSNERSKIERSVQRPQVSATAATADRARKTPAMPARGYSYLNLEAYVRRRRP